MSRKLVSFDWAIKRILRSKVNFEILEGFLSELLFEEIHILEVLESESNQDNKKDKSNRLDIKVKNANDDIIIIEIQYSSELDYLQRILYATSKVITEHLNKGDPYSKVSKVISVNILYFDFGEGDDYIYHGTTRFMGIHNNTPLKLNANQQQLYKSSKIETLYPEYYLIKVKNFDDIAKDSLDEWIYFLKNEEIKDNFKAKGLEKAKQELNYLKMPDPERLKYERYQSHLHHQASIYESTFVIGKMKGIKQGMEKGIEKGIEQEKENSRLQLQEEKRKIILRLAEKGFDAQEVAVISGVEVDTVKEILT